jgi:3-isopropylmalate/(R)-2-methylmalate dehydratase large subunit
VTTVQPYAHRILARAAGKPVRAGDRVEAALDRAVLSGARGPATLLQVRDGGGPWSADNLLLTMDFQAPEVESRTPRSRALCRELSEQFGLRHVFDLNMGIGSQVVLESALVVPGSLTAGSGRCLGVVGGAGALGLRLEEEDLVAAIVSGRAALTVPPAVRVTVEGRLGRQTGPLDLAVALARTVGPALPGCVELDGDVEAWGFDLRIAVCGLLAEMGAVAALVAPDALTARFFAERGVEEVDDDPVPSGDGGYDTAVRVSVKDLPAVVGTDYLGAFTNLPREGGAPIEGAFIGSCYGGRYDDLALVAEVLKKAGRVHSGVRLAVSPATLETARASLMAGHYETFLQAGAMVVVPGGGPGSAGGGAIFGEGERIASTAEYHRHLSPGQGLPEVHILSPAAAAVAAATGTLTDPAVYLT